MASKISRRQFVGRSGGLLGSSLLLGSLPACQPVSCGLPLDDRPNILLILTDQLHRLAPQFSNHLQTPNLARLTQESVQFREHYSASPICSPSRATILTGMLPHEHGVISNIGDRTQDELDPKIAGLGQILSAAGYDCGYQGKWHLSILPTRSKLEAYGFSDFDPAFLIGEYQFGQSDQNIARTASQWIESRCQSTPWFQVVSFVNPHDIYYPFLYGDKEKAPRREVLTSPSWQDDLAQKPESHLEYLLELSALGKYGPVSNGTAFPGEKRFSEYQAEDWNLYRSFYASLVEEVDRHIGTVLESLTPEVARKTIVILTSDHGDALGAHGLPWKGPFMYQENLRVPCLIRMPGVAPQRVDRLTSHIDLLPTLCQWAQAECPDRPGSDLSPLLTDPNAPWRRETYAQSIGVLFPVGESQIHTLLRETDQGIVKYSEYRDLGAQELYHLESDPFETTNVAGRAVAPPISADEMGESFLATRLEAWANYQSEPA